MKFRITKLVIFTTLFIPFLSWQPKPKWYRIVLKEYPGGTLYPPEEYGQTQYVDLYDHNFLKIKLYDKKGGMHLQCYSKDSVLLEEGNYVNSLALLKKQIHAFSAGNRDGKIYEFVELTEYYEPLRNGEWKFYDSTGKLRYSSFFEKGIEQGDNKKP